MNDRSVFSTGTGAPDFVSPETRIDLTNCDREPIHIPGAIQPHGVLLALEEPALGITMASASTAIHFGVAAEAVLGAGLDSVIGAQATEQVRALLLGSSDRRYAVIECDAGPVRGRRFDATMHRSDGFALLELEPEMDEGGVTAQQIGATMRSTVARLERAESLGDLAKGVAEEMRDITGFDRVWVYRFHPDWHGEIIGECKRAGIESWLGMHYPASDIPAQARALFLRNWLRVIPDIGFTPSPLVPTSNPQTDRPLDLGGALLRSVSPIHVQYLTNMGVSASLVISLIHRGKLWGLIAGHHYAGPKRVPYATRATCEFLAHALSLQIGVSDRLADRDHSLAIRKRQSQLIERLGAGEALEHALTAGPVTLADLTDADGAAVVRGHEITRVGRAPSDNEIRELVTWLRTKTTDRMESSSLAREFHPATAYADVASGLLALPISPNRGDQLLWFRGARRQTVRWAGDPRKPVTIDEGGVARLHPRGSFELWEEEVSGTSLPWKPIEREAAQELRRAVLDLLIRRAEEVALLNEELMETNARLEENAVELEVQTHALLEQRQLREDLLVGERRARGDAESANRAKAEFLAVMSHELRTPLNAIGGYAQLIALGLRGPTTPGQLADLERIQVNQRHLLGLINSILNFTKLEAGAIQLSPTDIPLARMLRGLDAIVGPQMRAKELEFHILDCPDDVVVRADEEKLRQILLNLLTNALKFTGAGGTIAIICRTLDGRVEIAVRDTGRGIPPESLEAVFEPFVQVDRALTPASEQGIGLGLAISRELARAMDGDLSVTSEIGKGSTFALTLPPAR